MAKMTSTSFRAFPACLCCHTLSGCSTFQQDAFQSLCADPHSQISLRSWKRKRSCLPRKRLAHLIYIAVENWHFTFKRLILTAPKTHAMEAPPLST